MTVFSAKVTAWAERLDELGRRQHPCFFLMDFERAMPRVWDLTETAPDLPAFAFPGRAGCLPGDKGAPPVGLSPRHVAPETFRTAFRIVQDGLQRGDSFLTNLTFPTPIRLRGSLEDVYRQSEAKYRILLPGHFACFSPETFVTVSDTGYIESRPMKGTAEDTPTGRAALLDSPKEIAEHATIVDLIRNDLSQVAKRVRVTDYRYFHKTATGNRGLVQTSSKVGGYLSADWRGQLGTTLARLLPAGSVSGAPKPATLSIIRRAENGPRGYYCGIGGYFDGRTVDTCVLIRFIERTERGDYLFRSGGGITARSNWREEYAELQSKIRIPTVARTFSLH